MGVVGRRFCAAHAVLVSEMQTVSEGSRHPSQGSTILAMHLILLLLLAVPLCAHNGVVTIDAPVEGS